MRFSRFFSKSSIFFSIELFPSREHIEQKKKNQSNMSFLWSVMIESALKIMIFAVCPNFVRIFRLMVRVMVLSSYKNSIEKSTFSFSRIFQFSGQLFQFFFPQKSYSDIFFKLAKSVQPFLSDALTNEQAFHFDLYRL
jgi:hypothetical protein